MNEIEQTAKPLKDKSRLITKVGNKALITHKFTPDGQVIDETNFVKPRDISMLTQTDLKFLVLWEENGYDRKKTEGECGLTADQTARLFKKLAYFEQENHWIKAAVAKATPGFVIGQDLKNFYEGGTLNDSQHKSLDRVAKCVGAYKTTEVNVTQNFLQLPDLSDEKRKEIKDFFDTIATQQEPAA